MEQFDAKQKVFKLPELVETLVSLLDPQSALRLMQSRVVDKETRKKSLSSEAWNKLIRRSLRDGSGQLQEEEVKNLVNILKLVEVDELRTFLLPLLDLICQSGFVPELDQHDNEIHLICPSHPAAPHVVSHGDFLLLELVEAAFQTAEQSISKVRSKKEMYDKFLSPISSRMSRQEEEVTSVIIYDICLKDQSDIGAFLTLLQAQKIWIFGSLNPCYRINQDGWRVLASGLRDKGRANVTLFAVGIGIKDVSEGMKDTIKVLWEAVDTSIWVHNNVGYGPIVYKRSRDKDRAVYKEREDWEGAWTRLQEIPSEIEAEQAKEAKDFIQRMIARRQRWQMMSSSNK